MMKPHERQEGRKSSIPEPTWGSGEGGARALSRTRPSLYGLLPASDTSGGPV